MTEWLLMLMKDIYCSEINAGMEPQFHDMTKYNLSYETLKELDEMVEEGYLLEKDGKYRFFL